MIIKTSKKEKMKKRHTRIRKKLTGSHNVPRLAFYRSNKHIYAQIIDDVNSKTLVSGSTLQLRSKNGVKVTWNKEACKKVGELIAKEAISKGIKKVVFDRGGYRYHGKVVEFAQGARSCGLEF